MVERKEPIVEKKVVEKVVEPIVMEDYPKQPVKIFTADDGKDYEALTRDEAMTEILLNTRKILGQLK